MICKILPTIIFSLGLLLAIGSVAVVESATLGSLFVFGDSYADTGNHNKDNPNLFQPWKAPYGETWPGKPAGRYSDGFLFTDFIAHFNGVSSPLPYQEWAKQPSSHNTSSSGLNFAFGGSGVFDTFGPLYRNFSVQIDQFVEVLKSNARWKNKLSASSALFTYSGNDYSAYLQKQSTKIGFPALIQKVVAQITRDLNRLYDGGIRKFIVTTVPPTGCLPFMTQSNNFTACNGTSNTWSVQHNSLLSRSLQRLGTLPGAQVITLDQYTAFLDVISNPHKFGFAKKALQPCCLGDVGAVCGSVDSEGRPRYSVCADARRAFFWDENHPSEAGWKAVTEKYRRLFR